MTREEFDKIGSERGFDFEGKITNEDYKKIEFVYTFHPSISETDGKKQIVDLVGAFGMRIICDMIPTAKKAKDLEEHIRTEQIRLNNLSKLLEDLREGREE